MLHKINVPYGAHTLQVGNMFISTAKIRIKTSLQTVNFFISDPSITVYDGKAGTVIITWATTNATLHDEWLKCVRRLCAHVMHKRIDQKYAEHTDIFGEDLPY